MHKITMPNGSVKFYRGNKLVCVRLPSGKMAHFTDKTTPAPPLAEKPKHPVPRVFKAKKFPSWLQRPEMEFRLPEDKS